MGTKRIVRGMQNVRTFTGKVGQSHEPHKIYMKITCIEMEKARRTKERDSAMQRVNNIDARFRDIEAEKAALIQSLEEGKIRRSGRSGDINTQPESVSRPEKKRFKFRY